MFTREPGREEGTMPAKTRLTAEDLWRLGGGDVRRELVNGEIVEMPPAGGVHGDIVVRLATPLREWAARQRAGVVVADVGFVLGLAYDPERVRGPDLAFVSAGRLPGGKVPRGFIPGAPDLALEILSPSESASEVQQKVSDYLEAGARLVWLVAPEARTATTYRPDGSARLLREGDVLDGEDVLPGFTIPLSELFA